MLNCKATEGLQGFRVHEAAPHLSKLQEESPRFEELLLRALEQTVYASVTGFVPSLEIAAQDA